MKIAKQLLKEFWFPFVLAAAWTFFSWKSGTTSLTPVALMAAFGPAFFLASWATSQIFRVKKQAKVEERLETMITDLERRTTDLVAHITGGSSFPRFAMTAMDPAPDLVTLLAHHHGEHTLYDVEARISDLDIFNAAMSSGQPPLQAMAAADTNVSLGLLIPDHVSLSSTNFDLTGKVAARFNIFSSARNGSFVQMLRLARIGADWVEASRTVKHTDAGEVVLFEEVHAKYPLGPNGEVVW